MVGHITIPALAAAGTPARYWVDGLGNIRDLNGATGVTVLRGERGLGMASVELALDKLPFVEGSIARHANTQPAELEIPLKITAATEAALEVVIDGMYKWFATANERARTPGAYRVLRADGTYRERACYVKAFQSGDLAGNRAGTLWQLATLILTAAAPFAVDTEDTILTYEAADIPTVVVIGGGHVQSYPVWTIQGPATGLTITNNTTGRAWGIDYTLSASDTLVVDTRPDFQRSTFQVYNGSGVNKFSHLTSDQDLWWLNHDSNNITITATGTSAATSFELRYRKQYHGLLR